MQELQRLDLPPRASSNPLRKIATATSAHLLSAEVGWQAVP